MRDSDPAEIPTTVRLADGATLPRVGLGTYSLDGEAGGRDARRPSASRGCSWARP